MARGDYYDVWLKDEATPRRVQATKDGSSVGIDTGETTGAIAKAPKEFIEVYEVNKANQLVRIFRFARSNVVAIEQGHETIKRTK